MQHEIRLNGYNATADDCMALTLGSKAGYGTEPLTVVAEDGWEGLAITATWHMPNAEPVWVLVGVDGASYAPAEVLAAGGSGSVTFAGVENGVQRVSCDLTYYVMENSGVGSAAQSPTPDVATQAVLETHADRLAAEAAARAAEQSARNAAESEENAADSAAESKAAAKKAENISAHPPELSENNTWLMWNYETQSYMDSGIDAVGPQGDTGPEGPEGPKGDKGNDGASMAHRWEGTTLVVSSGSGTSGADLKGDAGGYYTPTVRAAEKGLAFGWKRSETRLPELPEQEVTLPQADLAENDPASPAHVLHRTHWEEQATFVEFDGDITGKEVVWNEYLEKNAAFYYGATPYAPEDFLGAVIEKTYEGDEEGTITTLTSDDWYDVNGDGLMWQADGLLTLTTEEDADGTGQYPYAGIYLPHPDLTFGTSYTMTMRKSTVHKIDEKFLPELFSGSWNDLTGRPFGEMMVETRTTIESSTFTTGSTGGYTVTYDYHMYQWEGRKVYATLNGVEYSGVCYLDTNTGKFKVDFGSGITLEQAVVEGLPGWSGLVANTAYTVAIDLTSEEMGTVKLPEKYVPDVADWNAAEGETGHVKNRTHYERVETLISLENVTFDPANDLFGAAIPATAPAETTITINAGAQVNVIWDGTAYTCTAWIWNGMPIVGSSTNSYYLGETTEPFMIVAGDGLFAIWDVKTYVDYINAGETTPTVTHSVAVSTTTASPLDEKFIPEKVKHPDWDADYDHAKEVGSIANKPFGRKLQETITWDGDISGKITFNVTDSSGNTVHFCKIAEQLRGGLNVADVERTASSSGNIALFHMCEEIYVNGGGCLSEDRSLYYNQNSNLILTDASSVLVLDHNGVNTVWGVTPPEAGLYVAYTVNDSGAVTSYVSTIRKYSITKIPYTYMQVPILDCFYMDSSTADSTKRFKITVDDTGTITATEVT